MKPQTCTSLTHVPQETIQFFKLAEMLWDVGVTYFSNPARDLGGQNAALFFNSCYGKLREKNTQAHSLSPLDCHILHPPPPDEAKAKAGSSAEPRPVTADTSTDTALPCEDHG